MVGPLPHNGTRIPGFGRNTRPIMERVQTDLHEHGPNRTLIDCTLQINYLLQTMSIETCYSQTNTSWNKKH